MFGVEKSFFVGLSVAIFFSNWIASWMEERSRPRKKVYAFFAIALIALVIVSYPIWDQVIATWILFFVSFGFMKFVYYLHKREIRLAAEKKARKEDELKSRSGNGKNQ